MKIKKANIKGIIAGLIFLIFLMNITGAENITVGLVVKFPGNSTITECVQIPEYSNGKEIFEKSGAVLKGHFLLTSGLHSPVYWEKFQVLQFPNYTEQLCGMIANHFQKHRIQVVAGPTTGGIILAF